MYTRKVFFTVAIIAVAATLFFGGSAACKNKGEAAAERQPVVAGAFYPAGKAELGAMVDGFLARAKPPEVQGELKVLVVPHAGYVFSGQVAAYGYKELVGKSFDTVVLMCDSHRGYFDGIAVYPGGSWRTPLGGVKVDGDFARGLVKADPKARLDEAAFGGDHTLEVQLPFLQKVLKGEFKIVPVLFGNVGPEDFRGLADAILKNGKGKSVLVIGTTDLSHYPAYEDAKISDAKTIEGVVSGDVDTLEKNIAETKRKGLGNLATCACGEDAVKAAMLVAKGMGAGEIKLLGAANSGDVSGEKGRVVGYAAVGFFAPKGDAGGSLNGRERGELLTIAEQSVVSFVKKGKVPKFEIADPKLEEKLGAFVTLKKGGRLRGCIGRFSPTTIPLYEVVSQMAVAAASQDARFSPVKPGELEELTYEISVLSVPEKVKGWRDVVIGRDGVIIRKGLRSGVFLPQVATEHNMTLEQFLGELCAQKAGLPRDCYKDSGVELLVFRAEVFGE
jgi:AmmeMemoRadiSam system protein B/AmmeMemoRadiSam system protein A